MKTKCLIVDDEPPARELLTSYISRLDDFEVVVQFSNALDTFSYLQKNAVDLVFLDIEMPKMTGIELMKALQHPPRVIFTTAFREYASDGFDLDALDYLVKPISFDRFMKAIGKYHQHLPKPNNDSTPDNAFEQAYLFVKVNREQVKVHFKNILYIESLKDYIKIVTKEKSYITYERLTNMEEKLPEGRFLRIHKSYIIALDKVKTFRNDNVRIADADLPVGRVYKKSFVEAFNKVRF
jgi:DNA-binding LytR/AlgR family response regulator